MTTNMEALELARRARTDATLNKLWRDSRTGETYSIRARIENGAYAYRTRHVQRGKRDTYGLILASEIDGEVSYMTPVVPAAKLAYDYASHLPVIEFDEDNATIAREVTDAEWAHLTGEDVAS